MASWQGCIATGLVSRRKNTELRRDRWLAAGLIIRFVAIQQCSAGFCITIVAELGRRHPQANTIVWFLVPELIFLAYESAKQTKPKVHTHVVIPGLENDGSGIKLALIPNRMNQSWNISQRNALTWMINFLPDSPSMTRPMKSHPCARTSRLEAWTRS